MEIILTLAVAAALAFIPANLAKNKGHSFGLWWFYGWMLFIVAIIHVNFIPDLNTLKNNIDTVGAHPSIDELRKYKELHDMGAITQEELESKKKKLLNN